MRKRLIYNDLPRHRGSASKNRLGVGTLRFAYPTTTMASSITREVAHPRRTALRRPSARAPIFDQPQTAHDLFEPLGLAYGRVGRMPEPGGGDRLEIVASDLVLVEFQHALRRPHMHVGETQIPDARQAIRRNRFR